MKSPDRLSSPLFLVLTALLGLTACGAPSIRTSGLLGDYSSFDKRNDGLLDSVSLLLRLAPRADQFDHVAAA